MAYTTIDDPSAYFQTATYAGNGGTQSITNDGNSDLQPDWVWTKSRSDSSFHLVTDSTRGTTKRIYPNSTAAEETHSNMVTAFNSDGFSIGDHSAINTNGYNYIGWQWKANGGTTSSNTDGSITSTVQANTDAGFSIVTWTGNTTGSSQTIGHGLGSAPTTIIVKDRDSTAVWVSYHEPLGTGKYMQLNSTAAEGSISNYWSSTAPSSTVFGVIGDNGGVGYANNVSGNDMIAYCFAEKQGYSKFGSYKGNGDVNGPFVYTGFKPAFVMIKNTSATESWVMYDTKRNSFNAADLKLSPDTSDSENDNSAIGGTAYNNINILSNGFKCVKNNAATNGSGNTLIYMAFAENPFTTSTGIPTTAR